MNSSQVQYCLSSSGIQSLQRNRNILFLVPRRRTLVLLSRILFISISISIIDYHLSFSIFFRENKQPYLYQPRGIVVRERVLSRWLVDHGGAGG